MWYKKVYNFLNWNIILFKYSSFFGKAFEQVANKTDIEVSLDYFDTSIAKMQTKDRPKFFDALTALLSWQVFSIFSTA